MLDNGDPYTEIPLAKTLCELGWKYNYADMMEKSQAAAERSWELYARNAILPTPGRATDPRLLISEAYMKLSGDFNRAKTLLQSAFQDHVLREDHYNLSWVCIYQANTARWQGQYDAAEQYIQQAFEYTVTIDDLWTRAYCLRIWGEIAQRRDNLSDARKHFQNMGNIAKNFGNPSGIAGTHQQLGRIASLEGDYVEARYCFEQALAIFRTVGNTANLSTTLVFIGENALAQGYYGEARRYFREAIQLITQHQYLAYLTPHFLIPIGELFLLTGHRTLGLRLLALVRHLPVIDHSRQEQLERLLNRNHATVTEMQLTSVIVDFDAIADSLLDELLNSEDQATSVEEALSEPLSERELLILRLVAEGCSNREIAEQLVFSVATVKWYLTNLFIKLAVQSRTQAVARARQLNLLP
jgi:ATP/maltotriose-dependent transcriptional regulator MalT